MRKHLLVMVLAIVLISGIHTEFFAQNRIIKNTLETSEKTYGLYQWLEMDVPEGVDAVGDLFSWNDTISGTDIEEGALEWDQYGSKYIYNQLEENEKEFWDILNVLGLSYLTGKKNANNYRTWYGTDWVSYHDISKEKAVDIAYLFLYSNPQYYFFLPGYAVIETTEKTGSLALMFDERAADGQKRTTTTELIKQMVDECVVQINQEETALEKEKAAHDLICGKVVYDYDMSDDNVLHNQTIYSVFLTGKTVCAGYSQAMELLCNAVGIDCIAVTSVTHAWNLIRINDNWYYIDLTWNDGDNAVYYLYFNRSMEMLLALEGGNEGNEGECHVPLDYWTEYLPEAARDSGADYDDIGNVFTPEEQAAAPEILIDGYGSVSMAQDNDADIYYTTDGEMPSVAKTKSTEYKNMFDVSYGTVIKAIAVQDGYWDSEAITFEWPAETIRAYAGWPLVFYMKTEEGVYKADGLEQLGLGADAAVYEEASGKFKWMPTKEQIGESYELIFTAEKQDGQIVARVVEIQVVDALDEEFAIIGQESMALTEGYTAAETDSFAIAGTGEIPAVELSGNTGAGKIRWNDANKQIEIAGGLTKGIYRVALTAVISEEKKSTLEFELHITGSEEENHLPQFYNPEKNISAYEGIPLVFYVRAKDLDLGDIVTFGTPDFSGLGKKNNAKFDPDTGRFCWTPDEGMAGESCKVVFTAYDHAKKPIRYMVSIHVNAVSDSLALPFVINGPTEMTLTEGYAVAETDSFIITGTDPDAGVRLELPDTEISYRECFRWNPQTRQILIEQGLPAGDYEVMLTAAKWEVADDVPHQVSCRFALRIKKDYREVLRELCQAAQNGEWERYTSASRAEFDAILSAINRILGNPKASADDIQAAITALTESGAVLETLEDAKIRQTAPYRKNNDEKINYTSESWENYQMALAETDDLPDDFTEEMMIERIDSLIRAYRELIWIVDKTEVSLLPAASDVWNLSGYSAPGVIGVNKKYTDAETGICYKITDNSKKTVSVAACTNKNAVCIVIPGTVAINSVKYKVTEIDNHAFKGFKKLKKVTIGAKVEKIGKKSFCKCRKLNRIIIKSNKISSVQAGAFKGTNIKVTVKLSKKISVEQKKKIIKKLKNAGISKKAVIR